MRNKKRELTGMDDGADVVRTALLRAADSVHADAGTIRLADVMLAEASSALPRRGRVVRIAWAVALMALVAAVVASVSLAGTSKGSPAAHGSQSIPPIPHGSLNELALVAPGGAPAGEGSAPSDVDVIDPVSGRVDQYSLGGVSGGTALRWVVEGDVEVLVTDRPAQSSVFVEGKAIAFRPDQPTRPAWSLGPASDVIPSVTAGDVWIVTAPNGDNGIPPSGGPNGQGCTIREESVSGRILTPEYPLDCRRWVVAAVDGGLLSVPGVANADNFLYEPSPDTSPSTDFELQVWNPDRGTVVRTVSDHASFVLQASDRYVEWENLAEFNGSKAVHITDLVTGSTRVFDPKAPKGMVVEGGPVLAPTGPLVAYTLVTPEAAKSLAPSSISVACCVAPVASVEGRLVVEDFDSGATVLARSAPVSSNGTSFTHGDSFLVTTTDDSHVAFIPAWSASAAVTVVATPQPAMFSDAEDFTIAET
jgi:hypothetical protein